MNKFIFSLIMFLDLFVCIFLKNTTYMIYSVTLGLFVLLVIYKKYDILKIKNMSLFYGLITYIILLGYFLSFKFEEITQVYILSNSQNTEKNIYWLSLGLIAMFIGSIFALEKKNYLELQRSVFFNLFKHNVDNYLLVITFMILFLFYVDYFLFLKNLSYAELHTSAGSNIFSKAVNALEYFLIVIYIILSAKFEKLSKKKFFIFSFFLYISYYAFFINVRSPILSIILIFGYFNYNKEIFSIRSILLFIILITLFLFISTIRDSNLSYSSLSITFLNIVIGLGEFADTISFSLEYVEKHGVSPGLSFVNIFTDFKFANEYAYIISPEYFEEGGGFGFFYFSELIMNFGTYGAIIGMSGLGFFMTKFLYFKNVYSIIFSILVFINLFGFIRNDFSSTIKGLIYSFLCFIIIIFIFNKLPYRRLQNASI